MDGHGDGHDFGFDDAYRLRARADDDRARESAAREATGGGAPSAVLQTYTLSSYPASPAVFFACKVVSMFGTEAEGSAGTPVVGAGPVYALNLGSAVPPSGTNVLAAFCDFRWAFRYDG